jgi:exopolysaccharide biosynthesis polyprenyl glycosylphosphotransferase
LVVWLLDSVFVHGYLSNKQVLGLWLILFVLGLASRAVARTAVRSAVGPERCVAIGDPIEARRLSTSLENSSADARIVGVLSLQEDSALPDRRDTRRFPPQTTALPKDPEALRETLRLLGAHRVILVARHADSEQVLDLICLVKSLGVHVSLLPRVFEVVGSAVQFDEIEGVTVLGVRRFGLTPASRALKRAFDLLGATLGLIAALPIFAVIAVLIALDSPGPVFYRQIRVGHKGQRFLMIKFRTMENGADAHRSELAHLNEAEGIFKISNDPRVTRIGRPLRRLSIDELPQLVNVIRGQMSLVGPRPLAEDDDARVHGWHRRRLDLMPGMTGHWQVLGSARIPLREMVKIDYLYVANWSLWQDIKILLRTVSYVVGRRGQ